MHTCWARENPPSRLSLSSPPALFSLSSRSRAHHQLHPLGASPPPAAHVIPGNVCALSVDVANSGYPATATAAPRDGRRNGRCSSLTAENPTFLHVHRSRRSRAVCAELGQRTGVPLRARPSILPPLACDRHILRRLTAASRRPRVRATPAACVQRCCDTPRGLGRRPTPHHLIPLQCTARVGRRPRSGPLLSPPRACHNALTSAAQQADAGTQQGTRATAAAARRR